MEGERLGLKNVRNPSIAAILATFLSVLETLESRIMNDRGSDRKRAIEAKGILAAVTELKFIASLVVYKNVFGLTSALSEMLQNDSVDILSAITVVKVTSYHIYLIRIYNNFEMLTRVHSPAGSGIEKVSYSFINQT